MFDGDGIKHSEKGGDKQNTDQGGGNHAKEHRCPDGDLAGGACATGK